MADSILMLAHDFDKYKSTDIIGWWMSEKLEGQRAFWDGGLTRGIDKADVPWANTEKDARYSRVQVSTGLWSRYGHVIHAPAWFLDKLPPYLLDGELYAGRSISARQDLFSAIKKLAPQDHEWEGVSYHIFDTFNFADLRQPPPFKEIEQVAPFQTFQNRMQWLMHRNVPLHPQYKIVSMEQVKGKLTDITESGGEGLIVRDPNAFYAVKRVRSMLKMKPLHDSEATMIGWSSGRQTDKGSKLLGKMGSLLLNWKGIEFELSGFTDAERELIHSAYEWAINNPGKRSPTVAGCVHFEPGCQVNFTYRDVTRDGIPVEARFRRVRYED